MKEITKGPLSKDKKISLNLNEEFILLADKVGKLTNKNRTTVLLAFIGKGIEPLLDDMEKTWKSLAFAGNFEESKKKKLEELLKGLEKIKKEWKKTNNQWI